MKHSLVLAAVTIVVLYLLPGCSRNEPDNIGSIQGDVVLTTQKEVADFVSKNLSVGAIFIHGNLLIGPQDRLTPSNISDLSELTNIAEVTGQLRIELNPGLKLVTGFLSLTKVGDFNINRNATLQTVSFDKLTVVAGQLTIYGNESLEILDGFKNVEYIKSNLSVDSNQNLTSITSFTKVDSLLDLSLTFNPSLTNLNGFTNIKIIQQHLRIRQNDKVGTLSWFGNLTSIGGNLEISKTPGIGKLPQITFANLASIAGDFILAADKSETEMNLKKLTSIGGTLDFIDANFTNDVEGLSSLITVENDLRISRSTIKSLAGLASLKRVGGILTITQNDLLTNISLPNLETIGNYLEIALNKTLISLEGLPKLTSVQFLEIESNAQLIDFCPFKNILLEIIASHPGTDPNSLFSCSLNGANPTVQEVLDCE